MICVEGNHPIPEGDSFYPELRAYERPHQPGSGSGSSLVLREPTGRVACRKCVTRRLAGLSPLQEELV